MDIVIGRPLQCARSLRGNQIQQNSNFFPFTPFSQGFPGFPEFPCFFPPKRRVQKKKKKPLARPWPQITLFLSQNDLINILHECYTFSLDTAALHTTQITHTT
jgi:hypothetical protein